MLTSSIFISGARNASFQRSAFVRVPAPPGIAHGSVPVAPRRAGGAEVAPVTPGRACAHLFELPDEPDTSPHSDDDRSAAGGAVRVTTRQRRAAAIEATRNLRFHTHYSFLPSRSFFGRNRLQECVDVFLRRDTQAVFFRWMNDHIDSRLLPLNLSLKVCLCACACR